jgi:hypothetical protein
MAACSAALMLASCASSQPQRPLTQAEWCTKAAELLAMSANNPGLQIATTEKMRNRGCLQ